VLLCVPCHTEYEREARKFKKQIIIKYGISVNGTGYQYDHEIAIVKRFSGTLLEHAALIPQARKEEMYQVIKDYCKKDVTTEDMKKLVETLNPHTYSEDHLKHADAIAKLVDIQEFAREWRQHFIDSMQPKFLPLHWDVNRSVYKEN